MPLSAYILYNILTARSNNLKNGLIVLSLVTFLSGSVLFLRGFILFIDNLQSGKDYDTAKSVINKFTEGNKKLYITNGLWSLFDNVDNLALFDANNCKPGDTVIIQQAYHSFPESIINKSIVLYDWRTDEQIKFLGMKLTNTPHGYGFVICKIK